MSKPEEPEAPLCCFCREPAILELAEAWSDHAFMLDACCSAAHETAVEEMNHDPAWARALVRTIDAEALLGGSLRRVGDDGRGEMLLDWQLVLQPVTFRAAAAFVRRFHAHCGAPAGWRFGSAVWNGRTMLGVVMVGRPVARGFNDRDMVEVNRLCIRRDVPASLRWNACSKLYGWAAAEAERRGYTRIITYTHDDEPGVSLRAAGWQQEAQIRGRSWNTRCRARTDRAAPVDKVRWTRALHPRGPAPPRRKEPARLMPMHLGGEA